MRILSVGITNKRFARSDAGVTLVEMMIVVAIVGLLAAISYPSAAAGIDSLRLRSASNEVVTFLNAALEQASRHQQVVELRISPKENAMAARSADSTFVRSAAIAEPVRILSVQPVLENGGWRRGDAAIFALSGRVDSSDWGGDRDAGWAEEDGVGRPDYWCAAVGGGGAVRGLRRILAADERG